MITVQGQLRMMRPYLKNNLKKTKGAVGMAHLPSKAQGPEFLQSCRRERQRQILTLVK
jgi:hypothetical protein